MHNSHEPWYEVRWDENVLRFVQRGTCSILFNSPKLKRAKIWLMISIQENYSLVILWPIIFTIYTYATWDAWTRYGCGNGFLRVPSLKVKLKSWFIRVVYNRPTYTMVFTILMYINHETKMSLPDVYQLPFQWSSLSYSMTTHTNWPNCVKINEVKQVRQNDNKFEPFYNTFVIVFQNGANVRSP